MKAFFEKTLPDCNVCTSNLTLSTDNAKASLTVDSSNETFSTLQLDTIDNSNIINAGLSRGGLHLSSQGLRKLAISFTKKIKRSWQVVHSFHKKSFNSDFSQKSKMLSQEVKDMEAQISLALHIILMIYMKSDFKIQKG